ncbi:hypothetical protein ACFOD0_14245 [Shewanella intestini]|uniref:Uncharacterized protein n=1 Tax=Shewanella intestini TaxID=2017544 RepID=A0ABS5I4Q9_9GAMM|nr:MULTISPECIES: hypothetical protein [Shewanella]MBR9729013.1 hypothetical protein [Shewanella intestini]MRG36921.1 hypothetical protein [Shewanella sp. XMDDZSB0408]
MNKRNHSSAKHTHRKITLSRRRMTFFCGHTPTDVPSKTKPLGHTQKTG